MSIMDDVLKKELEVKALKEEAEAKGQNLIKVQEASAKEEAQRILEEGKLESKNIQEECQKEASLLKEKIDKELELEKAELVKLSKANSSAVQEFIKGRFYG